MEKTRMLSEEDLKKMEEICEAATPGPWCECGADRGGCQCRQIYSIPVDDVVATSASSDDAGCDLVPGRREDALFIAEAREGWPTALAEIRRLNEIETMSNFALVHLAEKLSHYRKEFNPVDLVLEAVGVGKEKLDELKKGERDGGV